jgi:hypothetical protein
MYVTVHIRNFYTNNCKFMCQGFCEVLIVNYC